VKSALSTTHNSRPKTHNSHTPRVSLTASAAPAPHHVSCLTRAAALSAVLGRHHQLAHYTTASLYRRSVSSDPPRAPHTANPGAAYCSRSSRPTKAASERRRLRSAGFVFRPQNSDRHGGLPQANFRSHRLDGGHVDRNRRAAFPAAEKSRERVNRSTSVRKRKIISWSRQRLRQQD